MERRKGIELCAAIVEIIQGCNDVVFLFAGDDLFGFFEHTLMPSLSEKQKGSIRYLGKLNFQQLRACARAVDIYLMPSLWESCPYSCLEAMAASRAIVCSDQGGLPELIQHGINGLLADPGSPQSFARQLQLLIDDRALRCALGKAARQSAEQQFTDDHIAAQTEKRYIKVLSQHLAKTHSHRRSTKTRPRPLENSFKGEAP